MRALHSLHSVPSRRSRRATLVDVQTALIEAIELEEWGGTGLLLVEITKDGSDFLGELEREAAWDALGRAVRRTDRVAYVGGRVFAVLLGGLVDFEDARVVAGRVLDGLETTSNDWLARTGLGMLTLGATAAEVWAAAERELQNSSGTWSIAPRETLRVRD